MKKVYSLNINKPEITPALAKLTIDYKKELNEQQYLAATSMEGAYLVIAGAGSGKTRTLTYRVAYMVEQGIAPQSILLLTFTRKAATEMMKRASSILDSRCLRISGGTFHSFANLVLRRHASLIDYPANFTITDSKDAEDIIGLVREELGLNKKEMRFPKKGTIHKIISAQVNTGKRIETILDESYPQYSYLVEDIKGIKKRYQEYKKRHGVMDYDDLLVNLKLLLERNDSIRRHLSTTYPYIMVDEYQDTNHIQADITRLLASEHNNVMVVGDDAQSIYSFRGANFKNIMEFPLIFPGCTTIMLEQNYRSTQPILDLTNMIIENAKEKYTKHLFSDISGKNKPVFLTPSSQQEQANFICQRILELREDGVDLEEIAVLFRAGWHSNELEVSMGHFGIPFIKYGGLKFIDAAHVKDLIALLRISYNPTDTISWLRILCLFDGVGPKSAGRLVTEIMNSEKGFNVLIDKKHSKKKYFPELEKLHEVLSNLSTENIVPSQAVSTAVEYYKPIGEKKYDDFDRYRFKDLQSLEKVSERFRNMEEMLTGMSLEPPETSQAEIAPEDKEEEHTVLSTIHSSKGLEWHTVFIINLVDGMFPSPKAFESRDSIEEERRLFYVAATRAKENLYILSPAGTSFGGSYYDSSAYSFSGTSGFITEIEDFDELVDEWYLS